MSCRKVTNRILFNGSFKNRTRIDTDFTDQNWHDSTKIVIFIRGGAPRRMRTLLKIVCSNRLSGHGLKPTLRTFFIAFGEQYAHGNSTEKTQIRSIPQVFP
jgi:hypothetical protein